MRPGIRLGVDVGSVRVGLAASDPGGILATPVRTLDRDLVSGADQVVIAAKVLECAALEVVVGLPRSLSGGEGPAAAGARVYASALAAAISPTPVRLVDERLTTIDAHRELQRVERVQPQPGGTAILALRRAEQRRRRWGFGKGRWWG